MSRECADCGMNTAPARRVCRDCSMEDRHGKPSDHTGTQPDADGVYCWVQDLNEDWHASMFFEGSRHVTACGEILETPVEGVKHDPRFFDSAHTCEDCEAALEADDTEAAVPDGGDFAKASELATDGGQVECDLCETLHDSVDAALRCCSERFEDVDVNGITTTVSGPVPTTFTRERGGSRWQ